MPTFFMVFYLMVSSVSQLLRGFLPLNSKTLTSADSALLRTCFHFASTNNFSECEYYVSLLCLPTSHPRSQMPCAELGTVHPQQRLGKEHRIYLHPQTSFHGPNSLPSSLCLFEPGWVRRTIVSRKVGIKKGTGVTVQIWNRYSGMGNRQTKSAAKRVTLLLPSSFI